MTARKSNPMVRGSSDADKVGKAYRGAMKLLPQLSEAEYKEEGLIEEAVHPVLDTLDDASRMRGLDPKVKASAAAMFQRLLHAVEMYDRLPSEGGHLASMREEYLEPHMRIGQTRRRNPSPEEHLDGAKHYLIVSMERARAGDLWKAYDFTMLAYSQAIDAAEYHAEGADEMLKRLSQRRETLKSQLVAQLSGGGGKVSNPRHGGAHYFVVLDKKGKQQFYTQTAAEARELIETNAKVRGGSYKHL